MAQKSSLELQLDWRTRRFADAAKGLNALASHIGGSLTHAPQYVSKELRDFLEGVGEALEQRHSGPWPGGTSSNTLSKRSGWMIEQIKDSVRVSGTLISQIEGEISVPYERKIHEHGGVIKARKAKYLTIPLPAALDSRGVPLKKSAKDWTNTFVAKSKAGNLIIFQRKGAQIIPLYVLKTQVYIPPRLGMGKTIMAGKDYLVDRLVDAILTGLRKGKM